MGELSRGVPRCTNETNTGSRGYPAKQGVPRRDTSGTELPVETVTDPGSIHHPAVPFLSCLESRIQRNT